jgi:hypothetical protein
VIVYFAVLTSAIWVQPTSNKVEFWAATLSPDEDFEVNILSFQRRDFDEQVAFTLTGSDDPIELATEELVS